MVPLGGLPGHQASGQPCLSGPSRRACASGIHVNRGCPAAATGYPGVKPQQHCPGVPQQVTPPGEREHMGVGQHGGVGLPPGTFSLLASNPGLLGLALFSQEQPILLNTKQESYMDSNVTFLLLSPLSSKRTPAAY